MLLSSPAPQPSPLSRYAAHPETLVVRLRFFAFAFVLTDCALHYFGCDDASGGSNNGGTIVVVVVVVVVAVVVGGAQQRRVLAMN